MRTKTAYLVYLSLALVIVFTAVFRLAAESPEVNYAAIEELLKKMTANQPVVALKVIREAKTSPIEGLWQVRFTVEVNGQRQNGLVYVSGDKVILGQMIDLSTQENLTNRGAGPPEPVVYDLKDLDIKDRVPRGPARAKTVIVEFSDFQCPYCKQVSSVLEDLVKKYPRDVVLYYKHFPISSSHPLAYQMAMATECARDQKPEAFWFFHDRLFSDPPIRTETELKEKIKEWSDRQGLKSDRFLVCYDKGEQAARIDKDMADGHRIGVSATPTFIMNGKFLPGAQPIEVFERLIKEK